MDYIILIVSFLITLLSSIILRIVYNIYNKSGVKSNYTGKETALKILKNNNLNDISVLPIAGSLSDYYNDSASEIRLSDGIYDESSIASVAVAAHECGHALQYKDDYFPIKIRNFLVPIVNIGNKLGYIAILISLFASLTKLFLLGIILISFAILFQLVTLPVEINASRRGKKELLRLKIIEPTEKFGVSVMLSAAAFTYIAGLLSSLLEVIRLIYIFSGNNRD